MADFVKHDASRNICKIYFNIVSVLYMAWPETYKRTNEEPSCVGTLGISYVRNPDYEKLFARRKGAYTRTKLERHVLLRYNEETSVL